MPKVTPKEGADKLITRAKAAAPHIAEQVDKVTVAPTAQAAEKIDKMQQKLMEAFASGKVERGLLRVSLEEWKRAMKEKGVPRIAQGLESSRSKIEEFNEQFYAFLEQVEREIRDMPDMTLEDSIARMIHNVRRISEFKRK